jgi:hypothetical protein
MPHEALTVAETIIQMATAGFRSGADQIPDGGIRESQAAGPLAALLYAASLAGQNQRLRVDSHRGEKHLGQRNRAHRYAHVRNFSNVMPYANLMCGNRHIRASLSP